MNLIDIENLPHDELKSRRDELVSVAANAPVAELAARYVQARTDARLRDDKLAEQGTTIASLNDALGAAKESIANHAATEAALTAKINELGQRCEALCAGHAEECRRSQAKFDQLHNAAGAERDELQAKLAAETARANRNCQLAARSEAAINAIAKTANDIIAARAVETTNEG